VSDLTSIVAAVAREYYGLVKEADDPTWDEQSEFNRATFNETMLPIVTSTMRHGLTVEALNLAGSWDAQVAVLEDRLNHGRGRNTLTMEEARVSRDVYKACAAQLRGLLFGLQVPGDTP